MGSAMVAEFRYRASRCNRHVRCVFPVNDGSGTWLSNMLIPVAWTLGVYYIFILPIFHFRRYRWNKKHGK